MFSSTCGWLDDGSFNLNTEVLKKKLLKLSLNSLVVDLERVEGVVIRSPATLPCEAMNLRLTTGQAEPVARYFYKKIDTRQILVLPSSQGRTL